jgi:hypothetical protein
MIEWTVVLFLAVKSERREERHNENENDGKCDPEKRGQEFSHHKLRINFC